MNIVGGAGMKAIVFIFWFVFSVNAYSVNPIEAVDDMSDAHIIWGIQESGRYAANGNLFKSYKVLEYYFLQSPEERRKVIDYINSHPDILEGGVISFSRMNIHDTFKKFGFDKRKAKEAIRVRLGIFKEVASDKQFLMAVDGYNQYFSENKKSDDFSSLDVELVAQKNRGKALIAKQLAKRIKKAKEKSEKEYASLTKAKSIEIGNKNYGGWYTSVSKDDFTDKIEASAFIFGKEVYGDYTTVGIRCMDGDIHLTFGMVRFIDSGSNNVNVRYRVDKNNSEELIGYTFSNSNDSGYSIQKIPEELVLQMRSGQKILIEVSNKRRSNIYQNSFSLIGFTKTYNRIWRNCK